jgi:hypothetical protein
MTRGATLVIDDAAKFERLTVETERFDDIVDRDVGKLLGLSQPFDRLLFLLRLLRRSDGRSGNAKTDRQHGCG